MRIEREHTAALIVDFQERLVPAIADHEALMERVRILLRGLKALEIPMTVTQQYTKGLGMSVPEVWEASGETEYLDKISFSALEVAEPKIHDKKYILVCGMEAHCCVLQTVIDLAGAGYVPVLGQTALEAEERVTARWRSAEQNRKVLFLRAVKRYYLSY